MSPTAIYPRDPEAMELFTRVGAAFAVDEEERFDALCVITATMAAYFAFAAASAAWLERHGVDSQQARDYVAHIYMGLAKTTVESPGRSFAELAADHATRGGTNEQALGYLKQHGIFERFDEALDGVLRRVTGRGPAGV
jgi:pyrroline-5-carboxylate reductase